MNTEPINWSLPAEDILSVLQESSMVKTGLKIRFNDVEDQFPGTNYRSVVATSVAKFAKVDAEAQIVMIAASGDGADLSHPSSQEKIRHIANEDDWPAELTQWVLTRCVQLKYRWESEGFATEPTLEEVTARKTAELARIEAERIEAERQARVEANRQEYAKLREDWIQVYSRGLQWINAQERSLAEPPALIEVFEENR